MSTITPMSNQPSMMWDQSTILEKGMDFLVGKHNQMNGIFGLFFSSVKCIDDKDMISIFKKYTEEVKEFESAVTRLYVDNLQENPLSDQTKQLLKISTVARHGLRYSTCFGETVSGLSLKYGLVALNGYQVVVGAVSGLIGAGLFGSCFKLSENTMDYIRAPIIFTATALLLGKWITNYVLENKVLQIFSLKKAFDSAIKES